MHASAAPQPSPTQQCDVLVIGGGPAGSTISTLLARKGWQVVTLEKDHHPRFHIGESLLPMNLPILAELGVMDEVEQIGIRKYGAEFNSMYHQDRPPAVYYFGRALDQGFPYAYEVKRADFDQILFRNAARSGARTHEGVRVTNVEFRDGQASIVDAVDEHGQAQRWEARYVVDASGRGTFLASKFDIKRRNPDPRSAAVFGPFKTVERRPGLDEGNISLYWFDHGWFWMIPFKDGTMSVGAVCWPYYLESRKASVEQFLLDTIALCPPVAARMKEAELISPVTATGNYSYKADHMAGRGYLLVGDAFAFIDPVFSSGVLLGMNSALQGAEVVDRVLKNPACEASEIRRFNRVVRHGIKYFSWFIYRITQPAMRSMFMSPRNTFRMEQGILSLLAGDLFRSTPIRYPLFMFKLVYRIAFLLNLRENLAARRRRRQSLAMSSAPVRNEGAV